MFFENLNTPIGELCIEADDKEVLAIRLGACDHQKHNAVTKACSKQLEEYFLGIRRNFDLPLALKGTQFQKMVWMELTKVQFATTSTYSEIAQRIGCPKAQRAVGSANHVNNFPIVVPCHRIVGKNRKLVGYALGLDKKAWLLSHESFVQGSL